MEHAANSAGVKIILSQREYNRPILIDVLDANVLVVPKLRADGLGIGLHRMLELRVSKFGAKLHHSKL
jgi:hypothetical protein